jgi:hypothetical protein
MKDHKSQSEHWKGRSAMATQGVKQDWQCVTIVDMENH